MKRKNKNNELVEPKKPAKPKAPIKPEQTKKETFEFSVANNYCYCEEYEAEDEVEVLCFVCEHGLQNICNKEKVSLADLLKIRSRFDVPDEEIFLVGDDYRIQMCISKNVENKKFNDQMLKYEKDIANYNSKLKEYENKLQEYMRLKEEFIRNSAEQEINRLSKILKG